MNASFKPILLPYLRTDAFCGEVKSTFKHVMYALLFTSKDGFVLFTRQVAENGFVFVFYFFQFPVPGSAGKGFIAQIDYFVNNIKVSCVVDNGIIGCVFRINLFPKIDLAFQVGRNGKIVFVQGMNVLGNLGNGGRAETCKKDKGEKRNQGLECELIGQMNRPFH